MRFVNFTATFDIILALLGLLSAWYLNRPEMYGLCFGVLLGGVILKTVVRAWDSVRSSIFRRSK